MPSRESMYLLPTSEKSLQLQVPDLKISPFQVEELVSEIKENLRLSATPKKSKQSITRRSSRASPYKLSIRCTKNCDTKSTCIDCMRKRRRLHECGFQKEENNDPYEALQKLLRDGNLIQEAVRRVQLGLSPKQRYFYSDSDDETCSPVKRYFESTCAQESAKCN